MSMLQQLASELGISRDELAANLTGGGTSDEALQPNYLTVDSSGNVGANFTGNLHAQGIDFDEPVGGPPSTAMIRWLRANGGLAATVYSTDFAANEQRTYLRAGPIDNEPSNMMHVVLARANNDVGAAPVDLKLENSRDLGGLGGALRRAYLLIRNETDTADIVKTLLDSLGASDWALLDSAPTFTGNATAAQFRSTGDSRTHTGGADQLQIVGANVFGGSKSGFLFSLGVNLYSDSTDHMQTDDNFRAVDGIATKVKAGTPTDADFSQTPPTGTIVVDTTANKIWVRTGAATWKGVVVA